MTEQKPKHEFIIKGFRLSFPQIWKAKAMKDGKPRYTVNLLGDPKDPKHKKQIIAVKKAVKALTKEAFRTKRELPEDRTCLRHNEDRWDGYEDMWYITAARSEDQGPPPVVDGSQQRLTKEQSTLKAGDYVNCKIRLYAQNYEGVKRVNASLEVIQLAKVGEGFGSSEVDVSDMPDVEEVDSFDDDDDDELDTDGIDDDEYDDYEDDDDLA